jgi:hypothetical protein
MIRQNYLRVTCTIQNVPTNTFHFSGAFFTAKFSFRNKANTTQDKKIY